jgi:phosphatidyl-myo-inositol alpha-mannosyltransferase
VKIALVCPYDWSKPGGVKAHVENLARTLYDRHEVRIFAPASASVAAPARSPQVVDLGRPIPVPFNRSVAPVALSPVAARRTVAALRAFEPHIVHVHEPFVPAVSAAAATWGPRPVIGTFHSWSDKDRAYRSIRRPARRVAAGLDARIAVSPAAQQYAGQALGIPLGMFRVIPNGVNAAAFTDAEPLKHLVDPARPLVLFVGRLEPRKGLDLLVRAFLRLRARRPDVRLCVVGEGPERERCQRMIPPSIRPDVLFVGSVSQDELPRYHASADVFVSPATGGESFGIVLLEAMAAGLPVVASDIPGYRTVMQEGRQGRLVPPSDAFVLADALDALLANDKLRRAMAAEGRQTADRYAWPVVSAEIEALYHEVIRRS